MIELFPIGSVVRIRAEWATPSQLEAHWVVEECRDWAGVFLPYQSKLVHRLGDSDCKVRVRTDALEHVPDALTLLAEVSE